MASVDSASITSPVIGSQTGASSRSRSSTKVNDDVMSLTSFNPFSEEDENEQSSYTLVTSLFSRVKNSFSTPLSSNATTSTNNTNPSPNPSSTQGPSDNRRPSYAGQTNSHTSSNFSFPKNSNVERPFAIRAPAAAAAPPLVSLTPAQSELPTYSAEYDRSPSRSGAFYSPVFETGDGIPGGTSIPGFPIQDDARSIKTATSLQRTGSVSKVMRRLRGEGLSRDYWMDDATCKECYDCKSVFTTWRRKHHCRICGQIFCSRCASNIIKGSRFGHDGMVRVCNLCLEKLAKVDEDDDDDRRSISSSVTYFPAHQHGLQRPGLHQSPFAASQLFGSTDEPFNLYSIAETKQPLNPYPSRPVTPHLAERDDGMWEQENPAPFRRPLSDEEPGTIPTSFQNGESSPAAPGINTPDELALTSATGKDGLTSSIQFPIKSPELTIDTPGLHERLRTRLDSFEIDPSTPFIRSRAHSRMDSLFTGEPGWRTRRESTAYAAELNLTSMLHLKVMLRQMLTSEQIPNAKEWEEVLLKLALRIARELTFTSLPHRQGEDMDVRKYVKIKKIPGGAPSDSEYVEGAVITKNVAHKQMQRSVRNPRIMLVTFPLEFHRVEGQYMHFGQIVRQEKEYLGNLASRIAALRPHVVLVEQSVSRLALDALAQNKIAVARSVKPSAIQTIARMTQGDVFSSMDKLALEPHLGHCAQFRIRTYDHPLIPGRRKTYMRFEGCSRDMGCTIILRGASIDILRRLKKVTRFLTFIVRNLKLETHLWKDSVITLPPFNPDAVPLPANGRSSPPPSAISVFSPTSLSTSRLFIARRQNTQHGATATITEVDSDNEEPQDDSAKQLQLSRKIDESLNAYTRTFISVSATLRFPPPYPIRRMKELDNDLIKAKQEWEDEVIRREEVEQRAQSLHTQESTVTATTPGEVSRIVPPVVVEDSNDLNAQIEALPSLILQGDHPLIETPMSISGMPEGNSYFLYPGGSANIETPSANAAFANATSVAKLNPEPLKTIEDIGPESKYTLLKWKHEEQRRIWQWYLRKNQDDFVVERYQCISLWQFTLPTAEVGKHQPCFAPQLIYITFYGENDCTLGQFIERSVNDTLAQFLDPKAICTGKGCDRPLARHCKVFVHNETRITIAVEQWDGQIIGRLHHHPSPDLITTWSACRICGSATPFIPVSEEMQRYSFAKFLELHFYPADVQLVQGAGCHHNIYQHHVRFFACKGFTVRFQSEDITMHEAVFPPFKIRVRPETQLQIKNSDFERLQQRNMMWYSALIDDLKLISIDAAVGDEEADAKLLADINALILRAEAEREDICNIINRIYRESAPCDTLALNQVHAYRQDKIVAWQQDFDRLPKPRPAPVGDRRAQRSSAFGSVRAMWPRRYDFAGAFEHPLFPSSHVSEAEGPLSARRVTGDSFTSSASEASESETNEEKPGKVSALVPPASATVCDTAEENHDEKAADKPTSSQPVEDSDAPKSEAESDSTIGARGQAEAEVAPVGDESAAEDSPVAQRSSRLPRRTNAPNVAELVKKYQDYLPAQGVHELSKTALSPRAVFSESEQEYVSPIPRRMPTRNRNRHHVPPRKASTSDFEQSYAANIAPRYLAPSKRPQGGAGSRIPGPITATVSTIPSRSQSRRPSPEKRSSDSRIQTRAGRPSSPSLRPPPEGKGKHRRVAHSKERTSQLRPPPTPGSRSAFRRPPTMTGNKVSTMTKHFERLGRDAERAKSRYTVIRGKRARPVASARAKVEVLDSIKDAIRDESESSDSSSEADDEDEGIEEEQPRPTPDPLPLATDSSAKSPEPTVQIAPPLVEVSDSTGVIQVEPEGQELVVPLPLPEPISLPPSPFLASMKQDAGTPPTSDAEYGGAAERSSILRAISGFWQNTGSRLSFDDDPMNDPEHIFRDSSMIVRTDEPTSIIALALNSPQYREMLAKSRAEKRTAREAKLNESGEAFMPDDKSMAESTSTWGVVNVDPAELADPTEDLRVPSSKLPWAVSFESGGLLISCTILYPEQFDALRRTYECDRSMIESLARCVKWNASGGKSGSAFLKTRDDRFIAKELSRPELQTMETFAPAYFDYMSSAVSADRPTLLAKVFGCFKITFKQTGKDKGPGKAKSTQMNLLVMENLFYDRSFTKIYDLKGSTRNRHVQSTGRKNEVLLDENLVETAHLNPFYLREHSKRILRGALYNDSKFLADINVMDYSLVCGVDSQNHELVVGIVDYIRTYTWDKKLESWVKESAFLGGRGEPTIVTPKQYRQRFVSAMERYFPLVPDRWMKQKDTPEEDLNCLTELWPDW